MDKQHIEIFGWYGAAAIITAYTCLHLGIIQEKTVLYVLLNFFGALSIVLPASIFRKIYHPKILNVIWAILAFYALVKILV